MTAQIRSWQTGVLLRPTPDRLTTLGWNGYGAADRRDFRYLTPKKRLTGDDLSGTPLLHAKAFHIICSPNRCRELVGDILALRKEHADEGSYVRPLFIWEPVPDLCTPDELLNCTNALPLVDVCSPNHAELAGFMGGDGLDPETGEISTKAVEMACEQLLASMPLQSCMSSPHPSLPHFLFSFDRVIGWSCGTSCDTNIQQDTFVIRAGEKGCYIAKNGGRKRPSKMASKKAKKKEYVRGGLQPDTDMFSLFAGLLRDDEGAVAREEIEVDPGVEMWVPPYHTDAEKVVDPTGGGNTFLGGLAVALARGKTVEEACAWGSVAAAFAIEQVGVPELGVDQEGKETWNCVRVDDRLNEFKERIGMS
jgi:hypothetical protein